MSGNISVDKIQLGNSITPANNFVIQTNTDGTAKLARGNIGSTISDIFNVDVAGNNIFNAKVGIGIAPTVPLQLRNSTIDQTQVLFSGITKGIRFVTNSTASAIEGVDYTGVGSYQPLNITGSILNMNIGATNALNIDSSGNVGIGIAPSAKLQVSGHMMVNDSSYAAYSVSNTAGTSWKGGYQFKSNGTVKYEIVTDIGASGSNSLSFYDTAAATTRLQIGPSGQLGIGGGATYGTAGYVLTSGGPSAAPSWSAPTSTGKLLVQQVNFTTGAVASASTTIPGDNTIPQITEGTEYMTLAITPNNASNILVIEVDFYGSPAGGLWAIAALFQDSTANALSAGIFYPAGASPVGLIRMRYVMSAGTTSSTTFRVRAGTQSGAALTFNGQSGTQLFGGAMASGITIREYTA